MGLYQINTHLHVSISHSCVSIVSSASSSGRVAAIGMLSGLLKHSPSLARRLTLHSSSKSSDATPKQQAALKGCIAKTRRNVHYLLGTIELCHWKLLALGLSLKAQLSFCHGEQEVEERQLNL